MNTILILMTLFIIKHFICDFYLQFDYMLQEKGIYGAEGGRHHALIHAAGTFLVLSSVISSVEAAALLAFLDGFIHYHIDWLKMNLNDKLNYTIDKPQFWTLLGADQMLHYLTYVGIIVILFKL